VIALNIFFSLPYLKPVSFEGLLAIARARGLWILGPSGAGKSFVACNLKEADAALKLFGIDKIGKHVGDKWICKPEDVKPAQVYFGHAEGAEKSPLLAEVLRVLIMPTWSQFCLASAAKIIQYTIKHGKDEKELKWTLDRFNKVRFSYEEYGHYFSMYAADPKFHCESIYYSQGELTDYTQGWDPREWQ
jgi:hypothetical protein